MVIGLDSLIVTLALPSIQKDLNTSIGQLQWTVDAYNLLLGGLLLFSGGLSDRFGRKLLLALGLLVFLASSLGAAFAGSVGELIAARGAMGVGGAMMMPPTLAIIKDVFPLEEQKRAIFIWSAVAGLGTPLGPLVGGLLLDHFWWGSVFLINVPVVALVLLGSLALIPESRADDHPGLDGFGAVLSVAGLATLVYGFIAASHYGWGDVRCFGFLILGVVVLTGYLIWERRTTSAMLSPNLFRNRAFGGPAAIIVFQSFAVAGSMFVLTQYLQFLLHYQPFQAGIRMLPILAMMLAAPLIKILSKAGGLKLTLTIGLLVISAASLLMSTGNAHNEIRVLIALGMIGLGLGLTMPTSVTAILAAAPSRQSGAGSAIVDTSVRLGAAFGVAVVGSVLATAYRSAMPVISGLSATDQHTARDSIGEAAAVAARAGGSLGARVIDSANQAYTHALSSATVISAVVVFVGAIVAAVILPGRPPAAELPAAVAVDQASEGSAVV
jgi:EmrB/QacA subfamily drug resistance transporter